MYQRTRLHGGKMEDCKTCTPIQKKKHERKDDKPRRQRAGTLELTLRRQMAEAIGEEELSKEGRFSLMMHFGLIAPRIDRRVTPPNWMEEKTWKILRQEFHNATKGLVPSYRPMTSQSPKPTRGSEISQKRFPYRGNPKFPVKRGDPRPTSRPQA
jgi:hypothetical protein